MRVLLVGPYPLRVDQPIGGVQAAVANLVHGLRGLSGIDVEVIANNDALIPLPDRPPAPFVTMLDQSAGLRGWWRDLQLGLVRSVRDRDVDVVHVQGLPSVAARIPRSILTVHGISERDVWFSGTGPARLPRTAAVGALEGLPRMAARRVIHVSPHRMPRRASGVWRSAWHVPNAIHPAFFADCSAPEVVNSALFVASGGITPLKNQGHVIRAFARVAREVPEAELVIAGNGIDSAYGRACQNLVVSLGLRHQVHFVGLQPTGSMVQLLRTAGTLVHASLQENAPMAIAEALASGASVVATPVGGVPAMLHDQPGCSLVEGRSSEGLAAHMLASCEATPEARQERRRLARRFSPSAVATATHSIYASTLQQR
jgi:glycosyltransferase involved in cell wall biosynthesis